MTEAEWLTCDEPKSMFAFLRGITTDRKLRLYFCAGCRCIENFLVLNVSRKAVDVAEKFADGLTTTEELRSAWDSAEEAAGFRDLPFEHLDAAAALAKFAACDVLLQLDPGSGQPYAFSRSSTFVFSWMLKIPWPKEWLAFDIFGNPFRPVSFNPEWRTSTVLTLAQNIYDSRDFSAMPILADALQDAGCNGEDILNHCRGLGPHVRGCWVVDAVLGKE
jgi:hypothetical protein